jgi:predicted DNA-binding transcriptional regulator AlpA
LPKNRLLNPSSAPTRALREALLSSVASVTAQNHPTVIIRRREVERRTGYHSVSIWRMEKRGQFPSRVQLNSNGAVGWVESEVEGWIRSRIRQGGKEPPVRYRGDRKSDGNAPEDPTQPERS